MKDVTKNSPQAWVLAARPKTLAAGSVPVLVGSALAAHFGCFNWLPALLCLMFALLAQIASNFSNDYYDFKKGTDDENRLGPPRAVASGWIAPRNMLYGTIAVVALACAFGLGLIYFGGWEMILVGVVCVISLIAYTAGPWPLAYHGLGDLFVLVFFGFVAVVFTYYLQANEFPWLAFVAGAVVGLGAVNILFINNFRDRETDRKSHKNTTIVLFGKAFGKWGYLINGLLACLLCLCFAAESLWAAFLPFVYLIPHYKTWKTMVKIDHGKELNLLIGQTARNLLILGLLLSIGLLL